VNNNTDTSYLLSYSLYCPICSIESALTECCSLGLEKEPIQKDISFPLCLAHNISPAIQELYCYGKD